MVGTVPMISRVWFEVVTGILSGSAITAAIFRVGIRIRLRRRLFLDDAFLGFACLALIAATAILYKGVWILYLSEQGIQDLVSAHGEGIPADVDVGNEILLLGYQRNLWLHGTFCWLAIFFVKFSFLSFFHQLVCRLPRLLLYWRIVVLLNVAALIYCMSYNFIECPHSNSEALKCLHLGGFEVKAGFIITSIGIAVDVLTDILVVSIPANILWQVKIKRCQKLGLGVLLSLSTCMVIIACIRFSGVRQGGLSMDVWQFFWLEVETCVAVCMVSLTAFRSLFASDLSRVNRIKARPWYSSNIAKLRRRKQQDRDLGDLPAIPSATLSGMRTFIRGSVGPVIEKTGDLSDCEPLYAQKAGHVDSGAG